MMKDDSSCWRVVLAIAAIWFHLRICTV